jgi:hypothetical protein
VFVVVDRDVAGGRTLPAVTRYRWFGAVHAEVVEVQSGFRRCHPSERVEDVGTDRQCQLSSAERR